MGITAYTRYSAETEIEYIARVACTLQERNNEASQTAVDMQPNIMLLCECGERRDIVHVSIRKVYRRADDLEQEPN